MSKISKILMISFIVILNIISCKKNDRIDRTILKIDVECGFHVDQSIYFLIDSIVMDCRNKIKIKKEYSENDKIEIFNIIANSIESFKIRNSDRTYGEILSRALKEKQFDCGNYTDIYLTVAEELNLPINAISAPNHIFVEWNDDNSQIYWETLYKKVTTKEHYIYSHHISNNSMQNKLYLEQLSNEQVIGDYYEMISEVLYKSGMQKSSLNYAYKAYKLYPQSVGIHINLATIYLKNNNFDSSLKYFKLSLTMNPSDPIIHNNFGSYFLRIEDFNNALKEFKLADSLNHNKFLKNKLKLDILFADSLLKIQNKKNKDSMMIFQNYKSNNE